jgi:CheY-like chemotaxis protein
MGNDDGNLRAAVWTSRRVTRGASKIRVLVVDDNVSAAKALATYLSLEGMECEAVFGGHAAVSLATEFKPHVIIMDISMPDCNGYQAALALRGDAYAKRSPSLRSLLWTKPNYANTLSTTSSTLITKRDRHRPGACTSSCRSPVKNTSTPWTFSTRFGRRQCRAISPLSCYRENA